MDESGELLLKTVISAVLAFIAGAGVGYINYLLTSALAAKRPRAAAAVMPLRTAVTAAFIAAAYFISKAARVSTVAVLIGAAVGLTAALLVFTIRSMKKSGDGGKEDA